MPDRPAPTREELVKLLRLAAQHMPYSTRKGNGELSAELLNAADALDAGGVRSSEWRDDPKVKAVREDIRWPLYDGFTLSTSEAMARGDTLLDALCDAVASCCGAGDSERMDFVEEFCDDVTFKKKLHGGEYRTVVVLDWFAGDGGGHWFTEGTTWREATDKAIAQTKGEPSDVIR